MATQDIAQGLVNLCNEGRFTDAVEQYYSPDIVSIEAMGNEQMPARMEGIDAIRGKNQWWIDNHEVHGMEIAGSFINQDQFAVRFKFDVTAKESGERMQMEEVGIYTVDDDKITQEQFFYNAG